MDVFSYEDVIIKVNKIIAGNPAKRYEAGNDEKYDDQVNKIFLHDFYVAFVKMKPGLIPE